MKHLVIRSYSVAVVALLACAVSVSALAGGKSKLCHRCGCEEHVKPVLRLVKTCEDVDVPSYVYAKEEVFYPDKGTVCQSGYRSDTFYDFWRECDYSKTADAAQHTEQHGLPQLHCSSYTVCGYQTHYGTKPTGCHTHCSIRVPGKTPRITTPILKWETVALCKDCCEKGEKK